MKDTDYYNNDLTQKRIENSNFKYQNWVNPNYIKYRNIYNPVTSNTIPEEYDDTKLNKNNIYESTNKNTMLNNLYGLFRLHHFSSIIKNQLLRKNNFQEINDNNNNNNIQNKKKKEHFLKKNWVSKIKDNNKIKHKINNKPQSDTINNYYPKSIISSSTQKIHTKKYNKTKDEYNKFLYDTYQEDEDDDPMEDPTYTYIEPQNDPKDNNSISLYSMNYPKDSIYHELYDILKDSDVINNLKNQNIITDNEISQGSDLDLIDNDYEGILTRSKYHKLINSDTFSTATEGLSSQTISESVSDSFKYQLPLRDTIAKATAQHEIDLSVGNSSNGHVEEDKHKSKWHPPILKKFNPFAHHDSSLEESSGSSCSGNTNSNNNETSGITNTSEIKDPYEFYRRTCVVCFDAQREIILWPCGCLCLCDDCREMMTFKSYKRCPCCQQEVKSFSKINLK